MVLCYYYPQGHEILAFVAVLSQICWEDVMTLGWRSWGSLKTKSKGGVAMGRVWLVKVTSRAQEFFIFFKFF